MLKNPNGTNKTNSEQVKSDDTSLNDAKKRLARLACYKFLFYGRSKNLNALDKKDELNLWCASFK